MKKDLKERLVNRKVGAPNKLLMTIGLWVLGILNKKYGVEFEYDYEPRSIDGQPTVLLSSHASRLEFIYSIYGFGRKDINVVCGYQNILKRGLYPLFIRLGVISKYLYQPDFMCVKNMLRALKRGGAVGLFPEGIQSSSGSTHPINPATTRFIKSCKANVVVCTTRGAYLATTRYSKDRKRGYIGVSYRLLFTPQMLETLSEEQIYAMLLESISYNDLEYNKTARNKYVGKKPNAFGIDRILYTCPECGAENTLRVVGDTIHCDCGFCARVNEYYDLLDADGNVYPFDIDEWYKWQRSRVARQITADGFEMTLNGRLCTLKTDKLRSEEKSREVLSVGTARLTKDGLYFTSKQGENEDKLKFPANSLYSLTFSPGGFLEFYYKDGYFMILPDDKEKCLVKWTLAAEEIHNLYDDKWRAASADAYKYDMGDVLWAKQQSLT